MKRFASGGFVSGAAPSLVDDCLLAPFVKKIAKPPSYPKEAWVHTVGVEPPTFDIHLSRVDIVIQMPPTPELSPKVAKMLRDQVDAKILRSMGLA